MKLKIVTPLRDEKNAPILTKIRQTVIANHADKKLMTLPSDFVDLSPEAKLLLQADNILRNYQKFSIEDYNSLTKLEKAVLREASSKYREVAKDSLRVGLKVKQNLDEKYGEEGYVFCCVGTSPSGVARVLEFTGAETKYLPISKLNHLPSVEGWKRHSHKFPKYQEFLEEQGLSKEQVEKSDKKYLFYDYIQQGMSMIVFEKMMREYFGLDLPNVGFHNFNYLCYSSCAENIDPPQYSIDYVKRYLEEQEISEFGGVPHLNLIEIDQIDECKNYQNRKAKMFNFIVIDELARKGLLKENPANKNSL